MTQQEFQIKLGPQLKEFITSPLGQTTIAVVHGMKPQYGESPHEHIFLENRGVVRGYEMAIRNLAYLTFVPDIKPEVAQDYGVKEADQKATPPAPVHVPVPVTTETSI